MAACKNRNTLKQKGIPVVPGCPVNPLGCVGSNFVVTMLTRFGRSWERDSPR
jgi:hypothetical protein